MVPFGMHSHTSAVYSSRVYYGKHVQKGPRSLCLLKPLHSLPGNDEQASGHLWQVCGDFPGDVCKAALHVRVYHTNVNWSNLCTQALGEPSIIRFRVCDNALPIAQKHQPGLGSWCIRCCVNPKEDIVLFLKNYVPGKGYKQKMVWETGPLKYAKEARSLGSLILI